MCECKHGDQVPGPTITQSEYRDTLNHAVKVSGYGDDWERGFCTGLTVGGTKVVPDPEPEPDPEDVRKLAQALAAAAFDKPWESFDDMARQALKRGVIAPGASDE